MLYGVLCQQKNPQPPGGMLQAAGCNVRPALAGPAWLRQLQLVYSKQSEILDLAACRARSGAERFKEDAARLVGPIL